MTTPLSDPAEFDRHMRGRQHVYSVSGHRNSPEELCGQHARQAADQLHHQTMLGLSTGLVAPDSPEREASIGKPHHGTCVACARQLEANQRPLKPLDLPDRTPTSRSPFGPEQRGLFRAPKHTLEPFRPLPPSLNAVGHQVWYHGTSERGVAHARQHGLMTPPGAMHPASWPMLTDSREQAERYAHGKVLEYHIPHELADYRHPEGLLWPADSHTAYDFPHAHAVAPKRPIPAEYLAAEHDVPSGETKQAVQQAPADLSFEHTEQPSGGSKWPTEHMLTAHTQGGKAGYLRYFTGPRERKVLIGNLDVEHDRQRQGIGSALMDEVQRRHPNASINHGDRTDAGNAWWKGYTQDKSVQRGRVQ
jgi:GNAT superfamily N-acetyltransferase